MRVVETVSATLGKVGIRKPQLSARRQQAISGWIFVFVPVALFFTFMLLPILIAAVLSFTDYSVIGKTSWVGVENYQKIFDDPFFWIALKNTARYTIMYVPLGLAVALGTALLLNQKRKAVRIVRSMYYVPVVTSTVATATIWYWLLNPQYGMFNVVLGWFGIDGPAWLYDSKWAMTAIVLMSVWAGFGSNMLIFLGGLQNVDPALVEAAELDGASAWGRFRHVVVPALSRTTFLVSTLLIIQALQVFDQAYVLTKGGPGNSTITIVYYIYNQGFDRLEMGYGSALSFVLFAIIGVTSLANARVNRAAGGES